MSKNSIMDNQEENYDIVIHGKTIREIIEQRLVLTSSIESGVCYWITQEEAIARRKLWDILEERLINKLNEGKTRYFLYGTGGNDKFEDDLEKMFYNPQNYGIVEKREEEKKTFGIFIPAYRQDDPSFTEGFTRENRKKK